MAGGWPDPEPSAPAWAWVQRVQSRLLLTRGQAFEYDLAVAVCQFQSAKSPGFMRNPLIAYS